MPGIYLRVQIIKKKKKQLEIFKIEVLSLSNMCVDLSFHHILAVTFFKTCLFTSLALGDCHTLQDNCCCICENVLVRVYRFDSGDLFFSHSGLFLLDLSSVVNTAFQITGQICSEYLKVAKNVTPGLCGMGL